MIEATTEDLLGEAGEPAITDVEQWEATWAKRKQEYRQQQANHWARRTQIEAQMESVYRGRLGAALQDAMGENRNPKVAEALEYVSMMLEAHWKNDPCHRFDDEQDRVSIFLCRGRMSGEPSCNPPFLGCGTIRSNALRGHDPISGTATRRLREALLGVGLSANLSTAN